MVYFIELKQLRHTRILFVKRKAGHLSYIQDPRGMRSILAWPFAKVIETSNSPYRYSLCPTPLINISLNILLFLSKLTDDPAMIAFTKYSHRIILDAEDDFLPSVLYECLTHEKTEIVNLYLDMNSAISNVSSGRSSFLTSDLWNLKLILSYYNTEAHKRIVGNEVEPLIQAGYVTSLSIRLRNVFSSKVNPTWIKDYFLNGLLNQLLVEGMERNLTAGFLEFYDIPFLDSELDKNLLR